MSPLQNQNSSCCRLQRRSVWVGAARACAGGGWVVGWVGCWGSGGGCGAQMKYQSTECRSSEGGGAGGIGRGGWRAGG